MQKFKQNNFNKKYKVEQIKESGTNEDETIKILSDIISNIIFKQIEVHEEGIIGDDATSAICKAKPKSIMVDR